MDNDLRIILRDYESSVQSHTTEINEKEVIYCITREFDSCLHFFTNQIAQNVDYINAFEFFCCQICEI